jgi:hypothetical protein
MKPSILGIPVALLCLAGCAAVPEAPGAWRPPQPIPAVADVFRRAPAADEVVLTFDNRRLRALRHRDVEAAALDLKRGQRIALWASVGFVGSYLVAEWLEDNVAFPSY